MRLICPNCGAQYEVPQSVIPENGRDVQCSSCGHTWFQKHPLQDNAIPAEGADDDMWEDHDTGQHRDHDAAASQAVDDAPEDEWQGFPTDPGIDDMPTPDTRLVPDPEDLPQQFPIVDEDDYEEDPARDLPTPRRTLDTSVADLLREEAEREARARAAERDPGLESQPDLGLDAAPAPMRDSEAERRAAESRERMARLRGETPQIPEPEDARIAPPPPPQPSPPQPRSFDRDEAQIAAAAAAAVAESRSALLPDIEEINSSLSSTSDRRPARADDHEKPGRSVDPRDVTVETPRGFSRGFSIVLLLAVLLIALYVFAPALAEAVPATAPAMATYVEAVNGLRVMLDAQVQKLSVWLAQIAGLTN